MASFTKGTAQSLALQTSSMICPLTSTTGVWLFVDQFGPSDFEVHARIITESSGSWSVGSNNDLNTIGISSADDLRDAKRISDTKFLFINQLPTGGVIYLCSVSGSTVTLDDSQSFPIDAGANFATSVCVLSSSLALILTEDGSETRVISVTIGASSLTVNDTAGSGKETITTSALGGSASVTLTSSTMMAVFGNDGNIHGCVITATSSTDITVGTVYDIGFASVIGITFTYPFVADEVAANTVQIGFYKSTSTEWWLVDLDSSGFGTPSQITGTYGAGRAVSGVTTSLFVSAAADNSQVIQYKLLDNTYTVQDSDSESTGADKIRLSKISESLIGVAWQETNTAYINLLTIVGNDYGVTHSAGGIPGSILVA